MKTFIDQVPVWGWFGLLGVGLLLAMLAPRHRHQTVVKARGLSGERRGPLPVLWRLLTGAHLDGKLRTDATWWLRGHNDLSQNKRAPKWAYLPRAARMGIRWGSAVFLAWFVAGWISDRTTTVVITVVLVLLAAGIVALLSIRRRRAAARMAAFVLPLHQALAKRVGHPDTIKPHEWIAIPRDFETADDAVIRLNLPPEFVATPAMQATVSETVVSKLGIELAEFDVRFHTTGHRPFVTYTRAVPAGSVREHLRVVQDPAPPPQRWNAQRRDVG